MKITYKKLLGAGAVAMMLVGGGCLASTNDEARIGNVDDGEEAAGPDRSESGVVTSVNLDAIAYDGPAVMTIKNSAGASVVINVPSFGMALCAASKNIADVYAMKSGDKVEVRGEVTSDGAIVPCQSSEHYLRVTR